MNNVCYEFFSAGFICRTHKAFKMEFSIPKRYQNDFSLFLEKNSFGGVKESRAL